MRRFPFKGTEIEKYSQVLAKTRSVPMRLLLGCLRTTAVEYYTLGIWSKITIGKIRSRTRGNTTFFSHKLYL